MGLNKEQIDGHKKRVLTRKLGGTPWFSEEAKKNLKEAFSKQSWKLHQKEAREKSEYYLMINFRQFMKYRDKIKIEKHKFCPCGKEILKTQDSRNKYCSKICAYKYKNNARVWLGKSRPEMMGLNNPNYKNGLSKKPYKEIQINGKRKKIHILIALKKYELENLPEGYVVHHLNGQKFDNSPDNLILMKRKEHSKLHSNLMKNHRNL